METWIRTALYIVLMLGLRSVCPQDWQPVECRDLRPGIPGGWQLNPLQPKAALHLCHYDNCC